MKYIKITFQSYDPLTNCNIYVIEISKKELLKWVKLPGISVSVPIALPVRKKQ